MIFLTIFRCITAETPTIPHLSVYKAIDASFIWKTFTYLNLSYFQIPSNTCSWLFIYTLLQPTRSCAMFLLHSRWFPSLGLNDVCKTELYYGLYNLHDQYYLLSMKLPKEENPPCVLPSLIYRSINLVTSYYKIVIMIIIWGFRHLTGSKISIQTVLDFYNSFTEVFGT